jgi:hypothetical protein
MLLLHSECLGYPAEVFIVVIGVREAPVDGDSSSRLMYLHLEVGLVGDGHESWVR